MWMLATGDILVEVNEALCSLGQASAEQSLGGLSPWGRQLSQPLQLFLSRSWEQTFSPTSWEWDLADISFSFYFSYIELLDLSTFMLGVLSSFPSPCLLEGSKDDFPLTCSRPIGLTLLILQLLTTNTCSISPELNLESWMYFSQWENAVI